MHLAHTSPVPVLVVQSSGALKVWIESGKKLRVLGAMDAGQATLPVLEWMKKLGNAGPCIFTLAHIDPTPPATGDGAFLAAPESLLALETRLRAQVRGVLGAEAELTTLVQQTWHSVVDALLDIVHRTGTDLIVAGADQWHGIGRLLHESVSRGLISRSAVSLLCLPAVPRQES